MALFSFFLGGDEEVEVDVDSLRPVQDKTIKVSKGDTLSKIASKHGTTVDALARINGIEDVNLIRVGQSLKVPSGKVTEQPEAVTQEEVSVEDQIPVEAEPAPFTRGPSLELSPEDRMRLDRLRPAENLGGTRGSSGLLHVKSFINTLNPWGKGVTELDIPEGSLVALKEAAINALNKGRSNVDYEDYPLASDGTKVRGLVASPESREESGGFMELATSNDPVVQAALTIGGGTLKEDENGEVYLTDIYDFSKIDKEKVTDFYSMIRWALGELSGSGMLNEFPSEIYIGHKSELVPSGKKFPKLAKMPPLERKERAELLPQDPNDIPMSGPDVINEDVPVFQEEVQRPARTETATYTVKKGDNLSKIAKEKGTTVKKLMELNGIKDANRLRVGQELTL